MARLQVTDQRHRLVTQLLVSVSYLYSATHGWTAYAGYLPEVLRFLGRTLASISQLYRLPLPGDDLHNRALALRTAIGNYGHTTPLKDGTIRSQMFEMEHKEISPVPMIFRRMVRALETFVDFNVAQGVIPEAVDPADLFLTETLA